MKEIKFLLVIALLSGCDEFRPQRNEFLFKSESMLPSIRPPCVIQWVSIDKNHVLNIGDLVVIKSPVNSSSNWVRRIVAEEGNVVQISDGFLEIDGIESQWGLVDEQTDDFGPTRTPENSYFLIGENLPYARDSREFGPFPRRSIVGIVSSINEISTPNKAVE